MSYYFHTHQASESDIEKNRSEDRPIPKHSPAAKEPAKLTSVPVALFGEHVQMNHRENNQPFKDAFDVSTFTIACQITVLMQL